MELFSKSTYRTVERLGEGGTATVTLAIAETESGFRRPCVIKSFKASAAIARVQAHGEAAVATSLQHANVVKALDVVHDERGVFHIVFEYVHGIDLSQLIAVCRQLRSPVSIPMAMFIVRETVRGLHFVHNLRTKGGGSADVLHADLSPANIMVSISGEVKLIDFSLGGTSMTLDYAAPERREGRSTDGRSDVYSAFAILWELLTLEPPPAPPRASRDARTVPVMAMRRLQELNPAVPADLRAVLERGLAPCVEARYESAIKSVRALTSLLSVHEPDFTPEKLGTFVDSVLKDEDRARFARMASALGNPDVLNRTGP